MNKKVTLPLEINTQKKGALFKITDNFQRIVTLKVLEPKIGKVSIRFRKQKSVVVKLKELSRYCKIPLPKPFNKPYAFLLYSIKRLTKYSKQIIL